MYLAVPETPTEALPLGISGALMSALLGWKLLRQDRSYQKRARQRTLADPSQIFARWTNPNGRDIVFAKAGLFLDDSYIAFAETYSALAAIDLRECQLSVTVRIKAGRRSVDKTTVARVPEDQIDAVSTGIQQLKTALLSARR